MSNLAAPILETQAPIAKREGKRNIRFDFLRIVFSVLVLFSHAPVITDGNGSREFFYGITRGAMTFGSLAVHGFFLLSGSLIVQSWERRPRVVDYLKKRFLRIVPGYVVAAALSTLTIGFLAPGIPHFFAHLVTVDFAKSILTLDTPQTPAVLPGNHYAMVNGSLWTIPYEFRCYLIVAVAGGLGLIRRRALWLAATVLLIAAIFLRPLEHRHVYGLIGIPQSFFTLTSTFFVGGCFYLFRRSVPFNRSVAGWAALGILALSLNRVTLEIGVVVFGGYLMFYFAQATASPLRWMRRIPDISYGIYLYGWPIEVLWIWYVGGSPWITFAASTLLSVCMGWLSWHVVESPAQRLGRPKGKERLWGVRVSQCRFTF
jgi:peptidoglycan/LPS O-acetylase OafA/YrhL